MSGIQAICMTLCYTCVAVSMITVLIPQKRTRRVMSFVFYQYLYHRGVGSVKCDRSDDAGYQRDTDTDL